MRYICIFVLTLALAVLFAARSSLSSSRPLRIPLIKKKASQSILDYDLLRENMARFKNGPFPANLNLIKSDYYAEIAIGTPPQKFVTAFNTITSDTWVLSKKCLDAGCQNHTLYDHDASSTYEANGTAYNFINLHLKGFESSDDVSVGGATVKGQLFGEISGPVPPKFGLWPGDAYLGIGFENALGDKLPGTFSNMLRQGVVSEPIIGFHVNSSSHSGELVFGDHYNSDFAWLPITQPNQWTFLVDGIQAGKNANSTICSGGCQALATTSTWTFGPELDVLALYDSIGIKNIVQFPNIDCSIVSSLSPITLKIAGIDYEQKPEDYVFNITKKTSTICYIRFVPSFSGYNMWFFGNSFIGKYYTQFDFGNKRIGFAKPT